jgi:ubiquinol oxidase
MEGPGPVSSRVVARAPFGPMERLDHEHLLAEQQASLESPRRRPGLSARALFLVMDVVYGKPRTLEKFRVLELVARVPYQAWENVAYVAVTHTARQHGFARRVFDRVRVSRWEQDNEQWHLLILEELTSDAPRGRG